MVGTQRVTPDKNPAHRSKAHHRKNIRVEKTFVFRETFQEQACRFQIRRCKILLIEAVSTCPVEIKLRNGCECHILAGLCPTFSIRPWCSTVSIGDKISAKKSPVVKRFRSCRWTSLFVKSQCGLTLMSIIVISTWQLGIFDNLRTQCATEPCLCVPEKRYNTLQIREFVCLLDETFGFEVWSFARALSVRRVSLLEGLVAHGFKLAFLVCAFALIESITNLLALRAQTFVLPFVFFLSFSRSFGTPISILVWTGSLRIQC